MVDNWKKGELKHVATLSEAKSGRVLEVFTTQPAAQVYTGNWLAGCPEGKDGAVYEDYGGVALECQHFPDSHNHPEFPSTRLNPGETFQQAIIFAFGCNSI